MGAIPDREAPVIRKSTPLSAQDLNDLQAIRRAPEYAGRSESAVLQELLHLGIALVKEQQVEAGYAEMAQQRDETRSARRTAARRRRPAWADQS